MLIVASMLFTVVIPLFLYVNMVNSVYNKAASEMERFDHERSTERLSVVAYPVENGSKLDIFVLNGAGILTEVARVWVTEVYNRTITMYDRSNMSASELVISPAGSSTIHGIDVSKFGDVKLLDVKVVTRRGNAFPSFNNPIFVVGNQTLPFNIQLSLYTKDVVFRRNVIVTSVYGNWMYSMYIEIHMPGNKGCNVFSSVGVPDIGWYRVDLYTVSGVLIHTAYAEVTPSVRVPWVYMQADPS